MPVEAESTDLVDEPWIDEVPAESVLPHSGVLGEFDWNRPASAAVVAQAPDDHNEVVEGIDLSDPARWVKPDTPVETGPEDGPPSESMSEYAAFAGELESPAIASHQTIVADLCGIVAVEGPVTGLRLRAAYVSAAHSRERDNVKSAIDRALHAAVAKGRLLVDDPLDLGDPGLMAYRTPDQSLSRWRTRGPRLIEQIPPRELAEVLAHHAQIHGWRDRHGLYRAVIKAFGQIRLTGNAAAALDRVADLAHSIEPGGSAAFTCR